MFIVKLERNRYQLLDDYSNTGLLLCVSQLGFKVVSKLLK